MTYYVHLLLLFLFYLSNNTTHATWVEEYNSCAWATLEQYMPPSCLFGANNASSFIADQRGNACLCPNEAYITDVAQDLNRYCGCDILERTAHTFVANCDETGTPAAFNDSQIVALGSGQAGDCVDVQATSTATGTATPTTNIGQPNPTSTESPSPNPTPVSEEGGKDSKLTIVGIILGSVFGFLTFVVTCLQLYGMWRKEPHLTPWWQIKQLWNRRSGTKHVVTGLSSAENGTPVSRVSSEGSFRTVTPDHVLGSH